MNLLREYCTRSGVLEAKKGLLFVDWRARRASMGDLKCTNAYESCKMRHSTMSPYWANTSRICCCEHVSGKLRTCTILGIWSTSAVGELDVVVVAVVVFDDVGLTPVAMPGVVDDAVVDEEDDPVVVDDDAEPAEVAEKNAAGGTIGD